MAHAQAANQHLEAGIRAALVFGDMRLLDHEIAWVRGLLANHQVPEQALARYLSVYTEKAGELLDASCKPVIEWLARAAE